MQVEFLLGPAGSGKTWRCLREVREALKADAEGAPLVFVAPKQATFQLERQLLSDPELAGYTRLHILSFERLARFVMERLGLPLPRLLNEEGRVMVLRALLRRKQEELTVFRASARMQGFARQLSELLRELQQCRVAPEELRKAAEPFGGDTHLGRKLNDIALLIESYREWLREHELEDSEALLTLAAEALQGAAKRNETPPGLGIGGLWLDGFAEMTPQELELLTTVITVSGRATLAFCLEDSPEEQREWFSTWAPMSRTSRQCLNRMAALDGVKVAVVTLSRREEDGRFGGNPVLRHLEEFWAQPRAFQPREVPPPSGNEQMTLGFTPGSAPMPVDEALRLVECPGREIEAEEAAREILQRVHAGGRFRDCAVLVRSLADYHDVLRRVFRRFEIPFFLDRREPVTHHPLTELTRSALRLAAGQWAHEDWFSALKTGLVPVEETEVDLLENEALAHGWKGADWSQPIHLPEAPERAALLERVRNAAVPPFADLLESLGRQPSARQLAASLSAFWTALGVEQTLEVWNEDAESPLHETVWEELNQWLENVEKAFGEEALGLEEWLPILEAGLAQLSVGVIPPALDQVLIGAVDRSRNPDLRLCVLLGLNEGLFPAPPPRPLILSETDREVLARNRLELGPGHRHLLGRERYLAYIACTRPSERLVCTWSARSPEGKECNPSPFVAHLLQLFPELKPDKITGRPPWCDAVHPGELTTLMWREKWLGEPSLEGLKPLLDIPELDEIRDRVEILHPVEEAESLAPSLAEAVYGKTLNTSVSRIENFGKCPFRFFVSAGLRAEERQEFEVDARERGSFQHDVLERFHLELMAEGLRWRDVSPGDARDRVGRIADELAGEYREGLFQATARSAFTAAFLKGKLQNFIETVIEWMADYAFDPVAVELAFGELEHEEDALPPWVLELGDGHAMAFRGKIDRVDLAPAPEGGESVCVVMDYKSSHRKLDLLLLENGIQIQLPAYLAAVCQLDLEERFGVQRLVPGGLFYLNLKGSFASGSTRKEVLAGYESTRRGAYRHEGRYSIDYVGLLDGRYATDGQPSGQFGVKITKDGTPYRNSTSTMDHDEFRAMLETVERQLLRMGREIYAGDTRVDPYRKGNQTACDYCEFQSVCRIDKWTHSWRALERAGEGGGRGSGEGGP